MKIIKNSLRYLLFSEIYFRLDEPKSKRKAFLILEAAIQCYSRKGFGNVTLEMIAREAMVTRPAIKKYFDSLDELELFVLKFIRLSYQKLTIDAMDKAVSPAQKLEEYLSACLNWTLQMRTHAIVWLSILHHSSRNKKLRQLTTASVVVGTERIFSILELGIAEKLFIVQNPKSIARSIQLLITGSVISALSEDLDLEELKSTLTRESFLMVGIQKL